MSATTPKGRWFKLDNAGKLYPAIATSRWSSVFRMAVRLKEPILPEVLQTAVDRVLPRFPAIAVRMRRGFFWYYLEANPQKLIVRADSGHPCMPFRWKENNGYLIRVLYDDTRIAVEVFHSIADGTGGLVFLKTLTAEYLRLRGLRIPSGEGVLDIKRKPSAGEMEDAFLRMPLPKVKLSRRDSRAYHLPVTAEPPHTLHIIAASMPFTAVRERAKAMGISPTEYFTAAFLYVCYQEQKRENPKKVRPIRVSVPVNMRGYFQTETLRNFSSFVNPEIDPRLGDYTFEEIARDVHAFMQYSLNPKLLFAGIATNVADEQNLFLRLAPLPVKNLAINTVFRYVGDRAVTTTLTSLGLVTAPKEMMAHVDRFEVLLGAAAKPGCNVALMSTGGTMTLFFTRNTVEATLPRLALRFLVEQGIPVTVESNQED